MSRKLFHFIRQPQARLIAKFGFIYLIFLALSWRRLDPDFGWHLKSGDYYRHHGIPAHDLYTYTARGFAWINHEWGNDVLLSLMYSLGGYFLASLFYAGLWTAAFAVRAMRVGFVFLLAATAAIMPYAGIRPLAWTFLLFAVLLNLLQRKKPPSYLSIAILFLLWANLHAGFIIGLAVILYYLVKTRRQYFAKLFGVSVLATFINPYGPRLYVEVGRTILDPQLHSQIGEWASLWIFKGSLAYICLWWAGFLLYRRRPLKNWLDLGPLLFVAALSATRNLPLFVIATVDGLEDYYKKFRAEAPKKLTLAAKSILVFAAAVLLGVIGYYSYQPLLFWQDRQATYPVQAAKFLAVHPCSGRLFNDYNYGGYLIWKLPNVPLYIDGRMSSWHDPSGKKYLDTYLDLFKNNNLRKSEFSRYQIKCVLVKTSNFKFIQNLEADKWTTVMQADGAILLEQEAN